MEGLQPWALWFRQAEGPFVIFFFGSIAVWRRIFCDLLSGAFWDLFLPTSYDPCIFDLSRTLTLGQ